MAGGISDGVILADLFFEQEHEALSKGYSHGWLRTAFVVTRALFARSPSKSSDCLEFESAASVAVVFFENENHAIVRAKDLLSIDTVMRFDLRGLPIIRKQLGLIKTIKEIVYFVRLVVRFKGFAYVSRSSIPLIGWLLYRTFASLLEKKTKVTLITTNMIHPSSVGVVWAAVEARQHVVFFEHATTPALIMIDRGYDEVIVNFEHTRQLLISKGFAPERVKSIYKMANILPMPIPPSARTIAICINGYDEIESIGAITEVLQARKLDVVYRIHDADLRVRQLSRMASSCGANVNFATSSKIDQFFGSVDLVITGNSNVIADALLVSKPVIYYWAGMEEMYDYYGFVKCYGVAHARSKESLDALLANLTNYASC